METLTLALTPRTVTGKAVKQLRKQGIVPAVIHDHGKESVHVQANYQELQKIVSTAGKHHPVQVDAGGKKYTTLIKSLSYDPRYNSIHHVVFGAVKADEKVTTEIPVHAVYAEGNEVSPAERAGLVVLTQQETVEVEALATQLPDVLTYDGEKLVEAGDQITVADLTAPAKVEIKTEPSVVLATVFEPSALQAANDEAGGDATAEDAKDVDSEHESTAEEGTQEPENRPGGKKQAEAAGE